MKTEIAKFLEQLDKLFPKDAPYHFVTMSDKEWREREARNKKGEVKKE